MDKKLINLVESIENLSLYELDILYDLLKEDTNKDTVKNLSQLYKDTKRSIEYKSGDIQEVIKNFVSIVSSKLKTKEWHYVGLENVEGDISFLTDKDVNEVIEIIDSYTHSVSPFLEDNYKKYIQNESNIIKKIEKQNYCYIPTYDLVELGLMGAFFTEENDPFYNYMEWV